MNPPGDAPGDVLFGLIAVNNNLVAPAVIPAALKARALEPTRTLAELLVSQGALTPAGATWSRPSAANTSIVGAAMPSRAWRL